MGGCLEPIAHLFELFQDRTIKAVRHGRLALRTPLPLGLRFVVQVIDLVAESVSAHARDHAAEYGVLDRRIARDHEHLKVLLTRIMSELLDHLVRARPIG